MSLHDEIESNKKTKDAYNPFGSEETFSPVSTSPSPFGEMETDQEAQASANPFGNLEEVPQGLWEQAKDSLFTAVDGAGDIAKEGLKGVGGVLFRNLPSYATDLASSLIERDLTNDKYQEIIGDSFKRQADKRDIAFDVTEDLFDTKLTGFRAFAKAADEGAMHPSLLQNAVRYLTTPAAELEARKEEKLALQREADFVNSGAAQVQEQLNQLTGLFNEGNVGEAEFYETRDKLKSDKKKVEEAFATKQAEANEFDIGKIAKLAEENPMQLLGTLYGGILSDPILMTVPGGQIRTAAATGNLLVKMGTTSKNLVATGRVVGGTAGATTLGAGLGAGISVTRQAAQGEEIDLAVVEDEAIIGAVFGAAVGVIASGVGAVTGKLRDVPEIDDIKDSHDFLAMLKQIDESTDGILPGSYSNQTIAKAQRNIDIDISPAARAVNEQTPFKRAVYVTTKGETIEVQASASESRKVLTDKLGPQIEAAQRSILPVKEAKQVATDIKSTEFTLKKAKRTLGNARAAVTRLTDKAGVVAEKNLKKLAAARGTVIRLELDVDKLEAKKVDLTAKLDAHKEAKGAKKRLIDDALEVPTPESTIVVEGVEARLVTNKYSLSEQGVEPRFNVFDNSRSLDTDAQAWNTLVNKALAGEAPLPKIPKTPDAPVVPSAVPKGPKAPKGTEELREPAFVGREVPVTRFNDPTATQLPKPRKLGTKKSILTSIAGKAPNVFKIWEDFSPTLAEFRKKLVMDPRKSRLDTGRTLSVEMQWQSGQKLSVLRDIDDLLKRTLGTNKLDEATNLELARVVRGIGNSKNKGIQQAGLAIRKHMQAMAKYAREGNVKVNNRKNGEEEAFFPHNFSSILKGKTKDATWTKDQQAFLDVVTGSDKRGRTATQAEEALTKITEGFDTSQGGLTSARKAFNTDSFNGRTLEVPEELLFEFLDNTDIIGQAKAYTLSAIQRTEVARIIGDNGTAAIKKQIALELKANGIQPDEVLFRNIDDIMDAINGQYGTVGHKAVEGTINGLVAFQTMSKLATTPLISLGEAATAVGRTSAKSTLLAVKDTLGIAIVRTLNMTGANIKLPKIFKEADLAGIIDDVAMASALDKAVGADTLGHLGSAAVHGFFRLTGLRLVTEYSRIVGFAAGRRELLSSIKSLSKDPTNPKAIEFLAEAGIDSTEALAWVSRGTKESDEFFTQIKQGAQQMVDDIIMHPDATKRPLWGSSQGPVKMVAHLKSFMTSYFNTVGSRVLADLTNSRKKEIPMDVAKNLLMMSATGAAMYFTSKGVDKIRGTDRRYDENEMDAVVRAFSKTLPIGPINYGKDAIDSTDYGVHVLKGFFGPTVGMLIDLPTAIADTATGANPDALREFAAEQLPFINVNKDVREKFIEVMGGGQLTHADNFKATQFVRDKIPTKFDKVTLNELKQLMADTYKPNDQDTGLPKPIGDVIKEATVLDNILNGLYDGDTNIVPAISLDEFDKVKDLLKENGIKEPQEAFAKVLEVKAKEPEDKTNVPKALGFKAPKVPAPNGTADSVDNAFDVLMNQLQAPGKPREPRAVPEAREAPTFNEPQGTPVSSVPIPAANIRPTALQQARKNTKVLGDEGLKGLIGQKNLFF